MSSAVRVVADVTSAPAGWDEAAVAAPGGHVYQSVAWAEYRAGAAETFRYLTFDDGAVALASLRRSTGLPGFEAVVRRGPAHRGEPPGRTAARAVALASWAREQGARDLYLDPQLDADATYSAAMDEAGYDVADERDPSIHVMRRTLAPDLDEAGLLASLSKSTRQRIRAARDAGTIVREHHDPVRMERFASLLRQRAAVLGIALQPGDEYLAGWRALIDAGLARLLLAEHAGDVAGGLFLFRQGGIWSTAYSADDAARRRELPGTMHLLRWVAVSEALVEGCPAVELGGVDLPGHREPPRPGDPNRGLYEHKRGFGAEWVEREPARRIVLRRGADAFARLRRHAIDAVRGVRR